MILFLINVTIFSVNLILILINMSSTHNLDLLLITHNPPIFQYVCARGCTLKLSSHRHHYLHRSLSWITGQYVSASFYMLENLARRTWIPFKDYFGRTLPFRLLYAPPWLSCGSDQARDVNCSLLRWLVHFWYFHWYIKQNLREVGQKLYSRWHL